MNIEQAKEKLDNALIVVARTAQEVADTAEYKNRGKGDSVYLVGLDDMDDLKKAVKEWKAATADYLLAVHNEKDGV